MSDPLYSNLLTATYREDTPKPLLGERFGYMRPMPYLSIIRSLELEFEKGKVDITLRDQDRFDIPTAPKREGGPKLSDTEYRLAIEAVMRKFLSDRQGQGCYLDCGSIGRCGQCRRDVNSFGAYVENNRDYYHKSGTPRTADPDELDAICLKMWVERSPSREIRYYLLDEGLDATDYQIRDAWERFYAKRR